MKSRKKCITAAWQRVFHGTTWLCNFLLFAWLQDVNDYFVFCAYGVEVSVKRMCSGVFYIEYLAHPDQASRGRQSIPRKRRDLVPKVNMMSGYIKFVKSTRPLLCFRLLLFSFRLGWTFSFTTWLHACILIQEMALSRSATKTLLYPFLISVKGRTFSRTTPTHNLYK